MANSNNLIILAFFIALSISSIHVCQAARHLLQVQPLPTLPPLPFYMPTLPQPTLPTTQPSLPMPTLPTLPKFAFPPLPITIPSIPTIPTTIPSIPFLSPPPAPSTP
ncbi:hypothetical protein CFOL_v3_09772 [Cephalotus follicularis]|uniref:Uncharacterized protein n=1 Tax=Cephalotus follicularis TaxID=3775 RepID=A0A1Q3BEK8_CEPFO|nr:hypothetical protein CFOL_v3_09772 [Cephalotus follicularis]